MGPREYKKLCDQNALFTEFKCESCYPSGCYQHSPEVKGFIKKFLEPSIHLITSELLFRYGVKPGTSFRLILVKEEPKK